MKKPPTKYVYKTPTTAKVIKPPTIKVIPNKPPMDSGPYGEATTTKINNIYGRRNITRPWTRLRKKI